MGFSRRPGRRVFHQRLKLSGQARIGVLFLIGLAGLAYLLVASVFLRQPLLILCSLVIVLAAKISLQLTRKQKKISAFILTSLSILLFCIVSTVMLSWNYGFSYLLFPLIPMSFLFLYGRERYRQTMIAAVITTVSVLVFFLLLMYLDSAQSSLPDYSQPICSINIGMSLILSAVSIALLTMEIHTANLELEKTLSTESVLVDLLKMLHGSRDIDATLHEVLSRIGSYLSADRTCIFQIQGNRIYNLYEWLKDGVPAVQKKFQSPDLAWLFRWLPLFEARQCLVLSNTRRLKALDDTGYELFSAWGVKNCIIAPLYEGDRLSGFLCAGNLPVQKFPAAQSLLFALAYFIASVLSARADKQLLEQLSYTDKMTGIGNRNAYLRDVQMHEYNKHEYSVGIIYFDLNGLKQLNDAKGHFAGDQALILLSDTIAEIFDRQSIYRIGGDEFVVICTGLSEAAFQAQVELFNVRCREKKTISVSVGTEWSASNRNILSLVRRADDKMYSMKQEFYTSSGHSPR